MQKFHDVAIYLRIKWKAYRGYLFVEEHKVRSKVYINIAKYIKCIFSSTAACTKVNCMSSEQVINCIFLIIGLMALIQWVQQVFWAMPSIEPLFCNALINYNIDSSIFCLCHSQATLWHPMCSVLSFLFYYLSHFSSMICTLRTLQLSMGFLKENI